MTHPLAAELAPLMHHELEDLHRVVARWVIEAPDAGQRARYRAFGSELSAMQRRVQQRAEPPTQEEIEIALTALLALVGRRLS